MYFYIHIKLLNTDSCKYIGNGSAIMFCKNSQDINFDTKVVVSQKWHLFWNVSSKYLVSRFDLIC